MRSVIGRLSIVAALVLGVLAVTGAPVQASAASADDGCTVDFQGVWGQFRCDTWIATISFQNDTQERFVVGTDSAVWTAWNDRSGGPAHGGQWWSMGGVAKMGVWAWTDSSSNAVFQVQGEDNNFYCQYRPWGSGLWSAWFQCNDWHRP